MLPACLLPSHCTLSIILDVENIFLIWLCQYYCCCHKCCHQLGHRICRHQTLEGITATVEVCQLHCLHHNQGLPTCLVFFHPVPIIDTAIWWIRWTGVYLLLKPKWVALLSRRTTAFFSSCFTISIWKLTLDVRLWKSDTKSSTILPCFAVGRLLLGHDNVLPHWR